MNTAYIRMYLKENTAYIRMHLKENTAYIRMYLKENTAYIRMYLKENTAYIRMYLKENTAYIDYCSVLDLPYALTKYSRSCGYNQNLPLQHSSVKHTSQHKAGLFPCDHWPHTVSDPYRASLYYH